MKNSTQEVHRPGPLKQDNKPHKVGRHRSNRSISAERKGKKLDVKKITKRPVDLKRHERRNQLEQLRKQKREEAIMSKRSLGTESSPPILVAILDLNSEDNQSASQLIKLIRCCDESAVVADHRNLHISIPRFKTRYEFLTVDKVNLFAALDAVKVCDILVIIHSIDQSDDFQLLLDSIYSHCLPTTIHALIGHNKNDGKTKKLLKSIQKCISVKFPDEKLWCINNSADALQLMNILGNCKRKTISFRQNHTQILAEDFNFEADLNDSSFGTLKVSGYIRNRPLDVNSLVHIPGFGDFQMDLIEAAIDPFPLISKANRKSIDESSNNSQRLLQQADPALQQTLESENVPDPMEGEQTWPTPEELAEAAANAKKTIKRVPKGTSAYQAAWIFDDEEDVDGELESSSESGDDNDEVDMNIQEEVDSDVEDESQMDNEELESIAITENEDLKYDEKMDMDDEQEQLKKFKEQKQDEMFPDEVDTPLNVAARVRFARYRGLKSFRTSPWDPKENLPSDYARIFQFENFNRTKKRVLKEEVSGVQRGWFVTVHIKKVPVAIQQCFYNNKNPLLIYALLPHEQKMSVLNLVIKKHSSCTEPIKSKEKLIFHVGCRRFFASPIFSSHTNGDKHKLERFLKDDCSVVATIFAPITFAPASVLVYKDNGGQHTLVATGFLMSCDPDRVVVKRIVLSGHPFKINRKNAVVRYMFFNREDILWFKPVELRTKYGRRGHIKEPLGTHGHMKCTFNKQLTSQDTVLMRLYKRVFPKWTYDQNLPLPTYIKPMETIDEEDDEMN